ncbi:MAG: 16S rRNA processing protein RimM [Muribaculaceae bacterium]|nr:16S rRNA processing protein RimM [Muribaculaceae bacterium]
MINRALLAEIGSFNKPHGIKGEISASFDDDVMDLLDDFNHLFVEIDGLMVPFTILSQRPKGRDSILLSLKSISDEKQAALLANRPIYIENELLPESEDAEGFFMDDLVGFTLYNVEKLVGVISGYDDSTENVLFSVRLNGGQEVLVPASDELIEEIDVDKKMIAMVLPSGLLDINS